MAETVPNIEQWSPELAEAIAFDNKLLSEETAARTEAQRLHSLSGEDDNRSARAARIAAGQTPGPASSIKSQLDEAITRLGDIQLARTIHGNKLHKTRRREEIRLCKELKPNYDANAAKLAEHLVGIYGLLTEMDQLVSSLRAQRVGFYPVVGNLDTETVFGSPNDPGSNIAALLRECKHFGHLNKLPTGLQ